MLFEKQRQDYEMKIQSLEEQVMQVSMMSSITPDDFDDEDAFGTLILH